MYSKLTPEVINTLICQLRQATRFRRAAISAGLSMYLSSVRSICREVGISHTTFYRWLKAYRGLKQRHEGLTLAEQLLCDFGSAAEAYLEVSSTSVIIGSNDLAPVIASHDAVAPEPPETPDDSSPSQNEDPKLSALESRTDELVSSVGEVVFDVPDFSLKNK